MPEVLMYSTRVCPYCVMAEKLLQKKGVQNLQKVLIGRGSAHSQKAAKELRKLGFTEVGVLDGGIGAWQTSGLPLIK